MGRRFALLFLWIIGILASGARAETTLAVELGWGGVFRAGHWAPVFITVSDTQPRNAEVEVYTGHDPLHGMRVHQRLTLNTTPTTYAIYVPMQSWGEQMSVQLRDARGKRLAWWSIDDLTERPFEITEQLIVLSGRRGAERLVEMQLTSGEPRIPHVDPLHLPAVARGYDALNLLMLNQPDLARIAPEQQEAMINWVRAGGHVVCWMGEDPAPGSSLILEALPAVISDNIAIQLPDAALLAAGLSERFRTLKGRNLMGNTGATEIPLLGGSASAWRRSLGLGSITLLPIDVSTLIFNSVDHAHDFWKPLLPGAIRFDQKQPPTQTNPNVAGLAQMDFSVQRQAEASNKAMEMMSDVPGAGDFGIGYVIIVMLAMMLLVGPIDWIVLKKLGRQPWTWVTTSGWIALITLGAVYIGYFFKSGDLHYRTLRLIDQVDGTAVAAVDVAGIYSPRTSVYELNVDPDGWWEPLAMGLNYYSSSRPLTDVHFHQDYRGNSPNPMVINVWNMRFLTGQTIAPGPPLVQAALQRVTREGREFLVGSITNVSSVPLKNFGFRVHSGRGIIGTETIEPDATLTVDSPISRQTRQNPTNPYTYNRPPPVGPEVYFDLAIDRSMMIEHLLESAEPHICLFAQIAAPNSNITLDPTPVVQRHQQYLRALLPLEAPTP